VPVGNDGETLVADSSTSTGLSYRANFAAGKNKIINGDFGIWQRGTSFTSPTANAYTADRWLQSFAVAPTTYSVTQQTFTPGTAPVAGYEGSTFYRGTITTVGSNTAWEHKQRIEDVRTFAGQTVTISFWAKADSSRTGRIFFYQVFGTGGSTAVYSTAYNFSLTSSWQRFTQTVSIASISGKTIGTGSYLEATIEQPAASGSVIDIWGVQVEAGSTATAFQTATGTIQGELAACQRYYFRLVTGNAGAFMNAHYYSSTQINATVTFPVTMRITPTLDVGTGTDYYLFIKGTNDGINSLTLGSDSNPQTGSVFNNSQASGVAGYAGYLYSANASAYVGFSSEL
jgi:hypothetical protein